MNRTILLPLLLFLAIAWSGQMLIAQTVVSDDGNGPFALLGQMVTVTSPNGGEGWNGGETQNIAWSLDPAVTLVNIDYSINGGHDWTPVAANEPNDGSYEWTVPATPSLDCLVRVSAVGAAANHDVSDGAFSISASEVESVTAPDTPTGPFIGAMNVSCSFGTGGSTSSLWHDLQYKFDWGDGTDSDWLPVGTIAASHAWATPNTYQVKAKARCAVHTGVESPWSEARAITIYETILPDILWNTFAGAASSDEGKDIAVDGSGNIYVVGTSYASWGNPLRAHSGAKDAFVAKYNSSGILLWNTFLGGTKDDSSVSIVVSNDGSIVIGGTSYASWGNPNYPFGGGSYYSDPFIAKISENGVLLWNCFYGSMGYSAVDIALQSNGEILFLISTGLIAKYDADGVKLTTIAPTSSGSKIAVDDEGNIYLLGSVNCSTSSCVGTAVNPYSGGIDARVVKCNANGSEQWHTFLGGSGSDYGLEIALDQIGNILIGGTSTSSWGSPINPFYGATSAFTAKLNPAGELQWNTFFGEQGAVHAKGIVADDNNDVFLAGYCNYSWGSPINPFSGHYDTFVVKVDSSGIYKWHTFLGGSDSDEVSGINLDNAGNIFLTGESSSTWGNPIDPYNGGSDAFIAKLGTKEFDLSVISPNGNEYWDMGSSQYITWSIVGSISAVNIDYSTDGGNSWIPVAAGAANNGAYKWTVPATPSLTCLVRVSDAANPAVHDVSDGVFFISASALESVSTPNPPTGPDAGTKNSQLTYSASGSASSLGHEIQYMFDWGDNSDSGWLGVGTTSAAHEWAVAGSYPVRAKARCAVHTGVESSWSEAIAVTINETLAQTLLWNTFLGNSDVNEANAVASDANGNIYVTGMSSLTWGNPLNPYAGGKDAFLAKLNAAGEIQWLTFMGGSRDEAGYAIAIDGEGNIVVTGDSSSTWGSPIRSYSGANKLFDTFVAKFTGDGTRLWNTFLGSSYYDYGRAIVIAGNGDIFVTGMSSSTWGSPINSHTGGTSNLDGLLAKLNSSGALQWHTFFGASGSPDQTTGIALDNSGNAFVSGYSAATWGSPIRAFSGGGNDAYVAKFNNSGTRLWHTFIGGSGADLASAIMLDGSANIFLTGNSNSSWGTPIHPFSSGTDGFLVKLKANGILQWNTFMGGSGADSGNGMVMDGSGSILVTGASDAAWGSPINPYNAGNDGIVVRFDLNGSLLLSSFLGGSGDDFGRGISLDGNGNIVIVGKSDHNWGSPVRGFSGNFDGFVAKLGFGASGLSVISPNGGEQWVAGSSHDVRWSLIGSMTAVNIDYSTNGGSNWISVASHTANDGVYSWTVPDTPTTACLVRVSDIDGNPSDASDAAFAILPSGTEIVSAPDAPAGPATGFLSTSYEFATGGSVSSLGHDIQYKFDWGDGSDSGWLAVGITTAAHGWAAAGTYNVQAIARCAEHTGVESAWSPPFPVTILETLAPTILWNTFQGSATLDNGNAIAADDSGNIYVAGKSAATWGSPLNAFAAMEDAFLAKLNAAGELQWLTFMGGSKNDCANAIAVDSGGNVIVIGISFATWGSPIRSYVGSSSAPDAFVAKFSSDGTRLWNTFLGGNNWENGAGVTLNGSDEIFVTGMSVKTWGSPINAHSGYTSGNYDGFVAKLSASGALLWNTFFGAKPNQDCARGITLDGSGNILVAGYSAAAWGTPLNPFSGGDYDAFVVKFNASGTRLWHTFLGGSSADQSGAIVADNSGNAFLTGYSASTWGSPVDPYSGGNDGFLAMLDSDGILQWNTFMGGSGADSGNGMVMDGSGCILVTGTSDAEWGSPVNPHSGGNDGFVAKFNPTGNRHWHTFAGGSAADSLKGIGVGNGGNILVVGNSDASWGSPVNPYSGGDDVLVLKLGF